MECIVRNTTRDAMIAERVRVATSPLARLRGLLGTARLAPGHGLLLRPCKQVHSFFMQYALDLVFVDAENCVVETVAEFPTNRISPLVPSAAAVLELPAGALAAAPARPGDRLSIAPRPDAAAER